ncbi:hypothetical protein PR048_027671 [Dryococelus australis]|uniref:Uncharacterized protein n=1 Tax=Dryococelus australis TaxID=614101 RepID=A0ABQ9GH62_9NEOP|nr:hypothetical protein PR048_027671 [Dryococelus australis]
MRSSCPDFVFGEQIMVTTSQEEFLVNKNNKAQLIAILKLRLVEAGVRVVEAKDDAGVLSYHRTRHRAIEESCHTCRRYLTYSTAPHLTLKKLAPAEVGLFELCILVEKKFEGIDYLLLCLYNRPLAGQSLIAPFELAALPPTKAVSTNIHRGHMFKAGLDFPSTLPTSAKELTSRGAVAWRFTDLGCGRLWVRMSGKAWEQREGGVDFISENEAIMAVADCKGGEMEASRIGRHGKAAEDQKAKGNERMKESETIRRARSRQEKLPTVEQDEKPDAWNKTVRLLASHHGEPGSIPGRFTPDFRKWDSCRTMPLIGGFSRGSPVCFAISSQRCSIPHSPISALSSNLFTLYNLWSVVLSTRGRITYVREEVGANLSWLPYPRNTPVVPASSDSGWGETKNGSRRSGMKMSEETASPRENPPDTRQCPPRYPRGILPFENFPRAAECGFTRDFRFRKGVTNQLGQPWIPNLVYTSSDGSWISSFHTSSLAHSFPGSLVHRKHVVHDRTMICLPQDTRHLVITHRSSNVESFGRVYSYPWSSDTLLIFPCSTILESPAVQARVPVVQHIAADCTWRHLPLLRDIGIGDRCRSRPATILLPHLGYWMTLTFDPRTLTLFINLLRHSPLDARLGDPGIIAGREYPPLDPDLLGVETAKDGYIVQIFEIVGHRIIVMYTSHTKQFEAAIRCEPFLEDTFLFGDAQRLELCIVEFLALVGLRIAQDVSFAHHIRDGLGDVTFILRLDRPSPGEFAIGVDGCQHVFVAFVDPSI